MSIKPSKDLYYSLESI